MHNYFVIYSFKEGMHVFGLVFSHGPNRDLRIAERIIECLIENCEREKETEREWVVPIPFQWFINWIVGILLYTINYKVKEIDVAKKIN